MGKLEVMGDISVPVSLGPDQIAQGMPTIELEGQNSAANGVSLERPCFKVYNILMLHYAA